MSNDPLNSSKLPLTIAPDAKPPAGIAELYDREPAWNTGLRHLRYIRESDRDSALQYANQIANGDIHRVADDASDPAAWVKAQADEQAEMMATYKRHLAEGEKRQEEARQARIKADLERERQRIEARYRRA